jgi:NADPH:quinone reductase-like Zn-dependent oxidoreductase
MKAVRMHEYGGVDVLRVEDVPVPERKPGEVLVDVVTAGVNLSEAAMRAGAFATKLPVEFPIGQGNDLAGYVREADPTSRFKVGDAVVGNAFRAAQAEVVAVPDGNLVPKPTSLDWDVAGALFVAGTTAWAATRAVDPKPGETVLVTAAAGGVGVIAAQLALATGARVIGVASEPNHGFLSALGIIPLAHGDGFVERLHALAPEGVDALIDNFGGGYVATAIELGVDPARINTIADQNAAERYGVSRKGNVTGQKAGALAEIVALAASGDLEVPIHATFPLDEVQAAYEQVERRHTRGKIVLRIREP